MNSYYYPDVQLLLLNESNQTVQMLYNDNPYTWTMALISERPPYYINPILFETFPII